MSSWLFFSIIFIIKGLCLVVCKIYFFAKNKYHIKVKKFIKFSIIII